MSLGEVGLEADGHTEFGDRLRQLPLFIQLDASVEPGLGVVGPGPGRLGRSCDRPLVLPFPVHGATRVRVDLGIGPRSRLTAGRGSPAEQDSDDREEPDQRRPGSCPTGEAPTTPDTLLVRVPIPLRARRPHGSSSFAPIIARRPTSSLPRCSGLRVRMSARLGRGLRLLVIGLLVIGLRRRACGVGLLVVGLLVVGLLVIGLLVVGLLVIGLLVIGLLVVGLLVVGLRLRLYEAFGRVLLRSSASGRPCQRPVGGRSAPSRLTDVVEGGLLLLRVVCRQRVGVDQTFPRVVFFMYVALPSWTSLPASSGALPISFSASGIVMRSLVLILHPFVQATHGRVVPEASDEYSNQTTTSRPMRTTRPMTLRTGDTGFFGRPAFPVAEELGIGHGTPLRSHGGRDAAGDADGQSLEDHPPGRGNAPGHRRRDPDPGVGPSLGAYS